MVLVLVLAIPAGKYDPEEVVAVGVISSENVLVPVGPVLDVDDDAGVCIDDAGVDADVEAKVEVEAGKSTSIISTKLFLYA